MRVTRIELAPQAWEAGILPLNYTRIIDFIIRRKISYARKNPNLRVYFQAE
jgi:hypothetical protein